MVPIYVSVCVDVKLDLAMDAITPFIESSMDLLDVVNGCSTIGSIIPLLLQARPSMAQP